MLIRQLHIERFRGFEECTIYPRRKTVIVGPNNSGKSTILEALNLLFNCGSGKSRPYPTESDYYERETELGFRIQAVIGELSEELRRETYLHLEGWDNEKRIVVPEPGGSNIEPVIRVQVLGTPELELVYQYLKPESEGARFSRKARQLLGWVYDGRRRDPSYQLAFYQGGILDQLFQGSDLKPALTALSDGILTGANAVNQDPAISTVLTRIKEDLLDLGLLPVPKGPSFEPKDVTTRRLLQSLRLVLARSESVSLPVFSLGRGAQRLLLVSILVRLVKATERPPIAAFEEPEEALEPVRQDQISEMLADLVDEEGGGQLFVVTHSTQVARTFELDDFILLSDSRSKQRPRHMADHLDSYSRQAYERRLDGPILRGIFAKIPILVEGPGDRAVLEVFWRALVRAKKVPHFAIYGVDIVNAEGISLMPLMAKVLKQADRTVVIWADQDTEEAIRELERLRSECNYEAMVLHNLDPSKNSLEGALVAGVSKEAIWTGLGEIANDRGYDFETQRTDLLSRLQGIEPDVRDKVKSSNSIKEFFQPLEISKARELATLALSAKTKKGKVPPFEMKGARPARLLASKILDIDKVVPTNFATAFEELGKWLTNGASGKWEYTMQ